MICCGVLFLAFGLVRVGWLRLLGRSPGKVSFPPAAQRSGPTESSPRRQPVARDVAAARGSTSAAILRFAAAGVAVYALAIFLLIVVDLAQVRVPQLWVWLARDAVFGVLALTVLAVARRLGGPPRQAVREQVGCALMGTGLAWSALSLVDMHVLALFDVTRGSLLADIVFHGMGSVAVLAGAVAMVRTVSRRRPVGSDRRDATVVPRRQSMPHALAAASSDATSKTISSR